MGIWRIMSKQLAFLDNTSGALDRDSISTCDLDSSSYHVVMTTICRQNANNEALRREICPSSEDFGLHPPVQHAFDMALHLAMASVGGRSIAVLEAEAAVATAVRMRLALNAERARKEASATQQQQQQEQSKEQQKCQQHQGGDKEALHQPKTPSQNITEQSSLWSTHALPGATDYQSGPLPLVTGSPSDRTRPHQAAFAYSSSSNSSDTIIAGNVMPAGATGSRSPDFIRSPLPHPTLAVYHQYPPHAHPNDEGPKSAKRTSRSTCDFLAVASGNTSIEGGAGFSHLDEDDLDFLAPGDGIAFAPDRVSWSALSQHTLETDDSCNSLSRQHTWEYASAANVVSALPGSRHGPVSRQGSVEGERARGGAREKEVGDEGGDGGGNRVLNFGSSGETEDEEDEQKPQRKQQEGQQQRDEKHMGSFEMKNSASGGCGGGGSSGHDGDTNNGSVTGSGGGNDGDKTVNGASGGSGSGGNGGGNGHVDGGGCGNGNGDNGGSGGGARGDRQIESQGGVPSCSGAESANRGNSSRGGANSNSDGGGGGRGGGGKGTTAACSRAVERYGTLLQSSPSWRCTEMYDIHDSLLLSNLSVCRATTAPQAQQRFLLQQQQQQQQQQQLQQPHSQRLAVMASPAVSPAAAATTRFTYAGYSALLTPFLAAAAESGEEGGIGAEPVEQAGVEPCLDRGTCALHSVPSDSSVVQSQRRGSLMGITRTTRWGVGAGPLRSVSHKILKYVSPQSATSCSPLKSSLTSSTDKDQLTGSGQRRSVLAVKAMHLFRPALRLSKSGGISNNTTTTSCTNYNGTNNNNINSKHSFEHSGCVTDGARGGGRRSLVLEGSAMSGILTTDILSAVLQDDDVEGNEQPRGRASMQYHHHHPQMRCRASTSTGTTTLSNSFLGGGMNGGVSGSGGVIGWGALLEELRESVTLGAPLGSRLRPSPSARAFTAKTTTGMMTAATVAAAGNNVGSTATTTAVGLRHGASLSGAEPQRGAAIASFEVRARRGRLTEVGVCGGYPAAPIVPSRTSLPTAASVDGQVRATDPRDTTEPTTATGMQPQHRKHIVSWSELQQTQPLPLPPTQPLPQAQPLPETQQQLQSQPQQHQQPQLVGNDPSKAPDRWAFARPSSARMSLSLPHPPSHPHSLLLLDLNENGTNGPRGIASCPVSPARRRTTPAVATIIPSSSGTAAAAVNGAEGPNPKSTCAATTVTVCDSPPTSRFCPSPYPSPSTSPLPLRGLQASALSYTAACGPVGASTLQIAAGSRAFIDSGPFSCASASPVIPASTATATQMGTASTPYGLRSYSCSQTAWSRAGQAGLRGEPMAGAAGPVTRLRAPQRLPSRLSQQGLPQYNHPGSWTAVQTVVVNPAVPEVPESSCVGDDTSTGGGGGSAAAVASGGGGSGPGGQCASGGSPDREGLEHGIGSSGVGKVHVRYSFEEQGTPSITAGWRSAAALARKSLRNFLTRHSADSDALRGSKVCPLTAPDQDTADHEEDGTEAVTTMVVRPVSPELRKVTSYAGYRTTLTPMAEADGDATSVCSNVFVGASVDVQVVWRDSAAADKATASVDASWKNQSNSRGPEKLRVRRLLRTLFGVRQQSRVAVVSDTTVSVQRPTVTGYYNQYRATSDGQLYSTSFQGIASPSSEKLGCTADKTSKVYSNSSGGDSSRPRVPSEVTTTTTTTAPACQVEILHVAESALVCNPQHHATHTPHQQSFGRPEARSADIQYATVSSCSIPDLKLCSSPQSTSLSITTGNPSPCPGSQNSAEINTRSTSVGPSPRARGRASGSLGVSFINSSGDDIESGAHCDVRPSSLRSPSPSVSPGQRFVPSPTPAQAVQIRSPRLTKQERAAREAHLRWIAPLAAAVLSPEPGTPPPQRSVRDRSRSRSRSKSRRRGLDGT